MAKSECRWQCPEQWSEWSEWLAAGLHARSRWRLPVLLIGMLFAGGRRTVTTWLRAAGVSDDFQDYYYFLAALGRKTKSVATQLIAARAADAPPARASAVGDRRFAHQAVRAESRGRRRPSQPDPGPGRPAVLCMVTSGSRFRSPCVIRSGGRWRCRCGPCSTSARRRWPRSPEGVVGSGSPPSSNWPRGWSNGWLRSSKGREKPSGS